MIILAMDTGSKTSSVALLQDGKLLGEINLNMNIVHSQTIMPMCKDLLKTCKHDISDVDVFAVANGPGSFTGLRIGISAIKGMAFAQNKPCVAVSSLEALAYNLIDFDGVICAVMDARRDQVYNALFSCENNKITRVCDDRALSISDLAEELKILKEKIIFVGDGADLCYNKIKANNITLAYAHNKNQRAASVGIIAYDKATAGEVITTGELEAKYLRLPQAERELIKRQDSLKISEEQK